MRLHVPIRLRWSDLDAYGARQQRRDAAPARGGAHPGVLAAGRRASTACRDRRSSTRGPGAETITLIARQEIEYLAPIPYLRAPARHRSCGSAASAARASRSATRCARRVGVEPRVLFTRGRDDDRAGRRRDRTSRERITDGERAAWAPLRRGRRVARSAR